MRFFVWLAAFVILAAAGTTGVRAEENHDVVNQMSLRLPLRATPTKSVPLATYEAVSRMIPGQEADSKRLLQAAQLQELADRAVAQLPVLPDAMLSWVDNDGAYAVLISPQNEVCFLYAEPQHEGAQKIAPGEETVKRLRAFCKISTLPQELILRQPRTDFLLVGLRREERGWDIAPVPLEPRVQKFMLDLKRLNELFPDSNAAGK